MEAIVVYIFLSLAVKHSVSLRFKQEVSLIEMFGLEPAHRTRANLVENVCERA